MSTIVKSRRKRRRLERRYRRTRCEADRLAYRSVCRTTNKLINSSRREHISNCLKEASGNSRQRWRIANELLHKNEKHGAAVSDADYQKQCNTFSDFFVEKLRLIAKTIADRLAVSDITPTAVATAPPVVMNNFDNVTVDEVIGVIKNIPLKMSPVDFVPTFLLKQCSDVFATLICRLANLSFSEGVFPDIFKVGQVTPLLKKPGASTNDPANYRPITNSNTIGKILERLAQRRIREHLSLSPNHGTFQSAYRALHSTETAMTRVVNDLLTAVDSGKPSVLLSLHISTTFDTMDHGRLLRRCSEVFGMSGQVCDWLRSYLTGRSSYVSLGQSRSVTVNCTTGVPQGSVLGPLLFTIFTTPVGHLITSFGISYHQYADDTQLYTSIDPATDSDLSKLSQCASAVTRWHLENGLLLNPAKTEALMTGTRQQIAKLDKSVGVRVAGTTVACSTSVRILGVTIDRYLTFHEHISNTVRSCNYHIRSLRHIRRLIDTETAKTLACSIVASRLDYCNALLYGVTSADLMRLQRVQHSLARVVCNAPYRSPSAPMLKSLHWLPIKQRIRYKIATMTYKIRLSQKPNYLRELIVDYRPARTLRSSSDDQLLIPRVHTKTAARAFRVAAPEIWNSVPNEIRTLPSLQQFCRRLKTHLFEQSFS